MGARMAHRPRYPLRSHRLRLRTLTDADVEALAAYRSLPDVCRYVPFEPMDEDAIRERVRDEWSRRTLEDGGDVLQLGVELDATGELIGDLMLFGVTSEHRSGEIGYVFHPAHAGHGYATEAAHRLLHVAFDDLALHRVTARVDAENLPSARVATRLGMRQEAHLVENEWFKGRWADELDFAILEREWEAQHAGGCPLEPHDAEGLHGRRPNR
jgi:RimJ/RimL family protein N-acetyltransferase